MVVQLLMDSTLGGARLAGRFLPFFALVHREGCFRAISALDDPQGWPVRWGRRQGLQARPQGAYLGPEGRSLRRQPLMVPMQPPQLRSGPHVALGAYQLATARHQPPAGPIAGQVPQEAGTQPQEPSDGDGDGSGAVEVTADLPFRESEERREVTGAEAREVEEVLELLGVHAHGIGGGQAVLRANRGVADIVNRRVSHRRNRRIIDITARVPWLSLSAVAALGASL